MYSLFNLLLFYTWIITSCASLQRDAGRASHLGIFLAYLGFWLLSSAPFLFCWEFLHSVCISTDSSGNGSGQMANVAWHTLERKALLTMTLQSFQLPMRLKLHHLCPAWGVQELLFPLILAGSYGTCAKGFESQVSPPHAEDVDVYGRGRWLNWEGMALLCFTSRTRDIMPVMSIASNNIRDISWCAGGDSITSRGPSRGGKSSTGLYCC